MSTVPWVRSLLLFVVIVGGSGSCGSRTRCRSRRGPTTRPSSRRSGCGSCATPTACRTSSGRPIATPRSGSLTPTPRTTSHAPGRARRGQRAPRAALVSEVALANDYYVGLVQVREQVDEQYTSLAADYRDLLEGYARGLNLYAYLHPDEADGRLFPMTGTRPRRRLRAQDPAHVRPRQAHRATRRRSADARRGAARLGAGVPRERVPGVERASRRRAVRRRHARLNVNSHQPWEGPVAWYEVNVVSESGWNITGGLFPGAPMPSMATTIISAGRSP